MKPKSIPDSIGDKSQKSKIRRGFTLVEILIVIAIIGILTAFLVANFASIRRTTRDAQRKSDLRSIQAALEIYRSDKGQYPSTSDLPLGSCGFSWVVGSITYIQTIPCDPLSSPYPQYDYSSSGNYTLRACLENIEDNQRDDVDGGTNDACGPPPTPPNGKVSYTLRNP